MVALDTSTYLKSFSDPGVPVSIRRDAFGGMEVGITDQKQTGMQGGTGLDWWDHICLLLEVVTSRQKSGQMGC